MSLHSQQRLVLQLLLLLQREDSQEASRMPSWPWV